MPDLSQTTLQQIKNNQIEDPAWEDEFIAPHYQGFSTLNIPATAAQVLGGKLAGSPALDSAISDHLPDGITNVIVILFDALAFHRFQHWCQEGPDLVWNQLAQGGLLTPLTAICPSTTCAAITSFWTAEPASRHGIMGYEMWLKEYGITANMIEHKPISYRLPGGNLSLAGFEPESFLPVKSITDQLLEDGVEVHAFQHFAIINSGLSRMFMRDAQRHPISTASDLWISIRELLETRGDAKKYLWAYWDKLDSISHIHGPDSDRAQAEFEVFSRAFERYFLRGLDPGVRRQTLVILTADHGQITTDKNDQGYSLRNHPGLLDLLHILPSGENRLAFLHIKPGRTAAVRDYIKQTWPDQFAIIEPEAAVAAGLFGGGELHPEIFNRIGDLIVAAKGKAYWWWAAKENPLIGRHGGLSAEEMLVPFLAATL